MPYAHAAQAEIDTSVAVKIPDGPVGSAAEWRKIINAKQLLQNALLEQTPAYLHVTGTTSSSFTVTAGPCVLAIQAGAVWGLVAPASDTTAGAAQIEGAPGSLSNSTWYYVYATRSGTSLELELSTTAPDASLAWKSGIATYTHRYLGCFRTNAWGVPLGLRRDGHGHSLYRARQQILSGGTATTATAVYVRPDGTTEEPLIPPHARLASLRWELQIGTAGANRALTIYGAGSANTADELYAYNLGGANYAVQLAHDVETDSSRQTMYALNAATGATQVAAWCCGWRE